MILFPDLNPIISTIYIRTYRLKRQISFSFSDLLLNRKIDIIHYFLTD